MSPAVIDVIAGVTVLCANCRFPIVIPATVRRERDRAEIAALIRAANEQVDPTAHLVYTIKAGMPQPVLARLLGPPTSARPDTWLYRDVPPGGATHIAIADGVVEAVRIDVGARQPFPCLAPAGRGTVDHSRTPDALVDELVSIAGGRGFLRSGSGAADGDTVRIGRLLNARGGTTLMRKVYAAVSVRVCHRSRELDLAWDGIGEW